VSAQTAEEENKKMTAVSAKITHLFNIPKHIATFFYIQCDRKGDLTLKILLSRRPQPLTSGLLPEQRFPGLPCQHFPGKHQLIFSLQNDFLELTTVYFLLQSIHVLNLYEIASEN